MQRESNELMHRCVVIADCAADGWQLDRARRSGLRVDAVDERGNPALAVASGAGELPVVEWLLERGADATLASPFSGRTALHAACAEGHIDVVLRLSRPAPTRRGATPRALARRARGGEPPPRRRARAARVGSGSVECVCASAKIRSE